jgi:predicted Zn-dependent peptidase
MYRDMPMRYVEEVLEETMWPVDPLGRDIAGQVTTVKKFSQAMFQDYLKRHYQTPNMILGVSGKYNQTALDRLIKKHWSGVPRHGFHRHSKVVDTQRATRIIS